jgi:hypothetical protein
VTLKPLDEKMCLNRVFGDVDCFHDSLFTDYTADSIGGFALSSNNFSNSLANYFIHLSVFIYSNIYDHRRGS